MIISASRRTDIPACFADWFFNRIRAGSVDVRNPMNPRQVSRIRLSPDVVDAIVFWTKNPLPMLDRLDELKEYMYYFLFTLTPYGTDIEPGLPDKADVLVSAFRRLAERIGPDRVIWRYDPILLTGIHTPGFHLEAFSRLARQLKGSTRTCIISFVDPYLGVARRMQPARLQAIPAEEQIALSRKLAAAAEGNGMRVTACAEPIDLRSCGIESARCIDDQLLSKLLGSPLHEPRGAKLREGCGCFPSIDIGQYDTCRIGCAYCYARRSDATAAGNEMRHNPHSTLIIGNISPDEVIRERRMVSLRR